MARWCSWLARQPVTLKVRGSSPLRVAIFENACSNASIFKKSNNLYASVAQQVEQGTENPCVGGSTPPRGTKFSHPLYGSNAFAGVAQLAEQLICNQQVAGSIPVTSSKM